MAAALREHRVEHFDDDALLGLGQGFDPFELLLDLWRRPALAGSGATRAAGQFLHPDIEQFE